MIINMMKIYAGIVLYQPELERLEENINAIKEQVDGIVIVDNASSDIEGIQRVVEKNLLDYKYYYIRLEENKGIAAALNIIVRKAQEQGCEWVLTLDQDSVCPENMITEYCKHIELEKVAMLCPVIKDRNFDTGQYKHEGISNTKRCITSGAFMKIKAFDEIGGFYEKLFIDYVDFEYNARLMNKGYRIYRVNAVVLLHQLGESHEVDFFGTRAVTTNHSVMRRYYNTRNRVYCAKKYKEYIGRQHTIKYFFKTIVLIYKYEEKKWSKISAMVRGAIVGLFMR